MTLSVKNVILVGGIAVVSVIAAKRLPVFRDLLL